MTRTGEPTSTRVVSRETVPGSPAGPVAKEHPSCSCTGPPATTRAGRPLLRYSSRTPPCTQTAVAAARVVTADDYADRGRAADVAAVVDAFGGQSTCWATRSVGSARWTLLTSGPPARALRGVAGTRRGREPHAAGERGADERAAGRGQARGRPRSLLPRSRRHARRRAGRLPRAARVAGAHRRRTAPTSGSRSWPVSSTSRWTSSRNSSSGTFSVSFASTVDRGRSEGFGRPPTACRDGFRESGRPGRSRIFFGSTKA